jgi:putative ABC transport system permease protein
LSRSLVNLRRVSPGFTSDHVATMHLAIPRSKYQTDPQVAAMCSAILERVREVPGVAAAGMVNRLPFSGIAQINTIQLASSAVDGSVPIDSRSVTPDYFRAMAIPLMEGRSFTDHDTAESSAVGIVDDRLATIAWPNESAIGRRFRIAAPGLPWVTIVGVVGHVRHEGPTTDPRPQVYWNYRQRPQDRMALVLKTSGDPQAIVGPVVAAIREVDPEQPVYDVRTMADVIGRATGQERLTASVVAVFAVFALLMSSIGVYGVMAYGVRLRSREFSIRLALGAANADLISTVLRRGAALVGMGLVAGVFAALLATRALGTMLHGVGSTDFISFAAAIVTLTISGLLATLIPARRAVSVEPMGVLRGE